MEINQVTKKANQIVKFVFKAHDQRHVMIGKVVMLSDSKELARKGMVRVVNQNRLDYWKDDAPQVGMTRIYVVSDFTQMIDSDWKPSEPVMFNQNSED